MPAKKKAAKAKKKTSLSKVSRDDVLRDVHDCLKEAFENKTRTYRISKSPSGQPYVMTIGKWQGILRDMRKLLGKPKYGGVYKKYAGKKTPEGLVGVTHEKTLGQIEIFIRNLLWQSFIPDNRKN